MKNVPSHHYPEVMVAMQMARVLAEADLVHSVADHVGDDDVIEWAARFVHEHGTLMAPLGLDMSQYQERLRIKTFEFARNQGWLPREERQTRCESPVDIVFKQKVAAVRTIQSIPGWIPRSRSHQALVDEVVVELQKRALRWLRIGGVHEKGEMSFESDGRFEKLKVHGISVASCTAGERDKRRWIAALESNLGIQVRPGAAHQVVVTVGDEDLVCTDQSVRIQVFSDRLGEQEPVSTLAFGFTHEGVITNSVEADGSLAGTSSVMYDDLNEDLRQQERAFERSAS